MPTPVPLFMVLALLERMALLEHTPPRRTGGFLLPLSSPHAPSNCPRNCLQPVGRHDRTLQLPSAAYSFLACSAALLMRLQGSRCLGVCAWRWTETRWETTWAPPTLAATSALPALWPAAVCSLRCEDGFNEPRLGLAVRALSLIHI